jgi:hypothetical protein
VDGHSIMMYNKYIVKIEVTNSFSEYYISNVDFIVFIFIFYFFYSYCILVYRLWQNCGTISSLKRLI